MNSWSPIWSGLVDSSIWEEPDHVFRVFMAMMSLKDSNHVVSMDGYRLAKRIHMPLEKVEDALKVLAAPDKRRPEQEFDGRRIKRVDDGWEIINGEYYRKLVSEEMKRVRNRRAQANWRENQKAKKHRLLPRGRSVDVEARAFEQSIENGEPESEQDKIVTRSLPNNGRIPGPCSYCGSPDHWRPDCPEIEKECKPGTLPDAGKVMVPNGTTEQRREHIGDYAALGFHVAQPTGDGKPIEVEEPQIICDRCHETGHKGEDCPIPMHLDCGKWVPG